MYRLIEETGHGVGAMERLPLKPLMRRRALESLPSEICVLTTTMEIATREPDVAGVHAMHSERALRGIDPQPSSEEAVLQMRNHDLRRDASGTVCMQSMCAVVLVGNATEGTAVCVAISVDARTLK